MAKKSNSAKTIEEIEDKVEGLFILTLDTFEDTLRKIRSGDIEVTAHMLNSITTFLDKNDFMLPKIKERRSFTSAKAKTYTLPTFEGYDEDPDSYPYGKLTPKTETDDEWE
ncbi:hypothetical protein WDZ92_34895 [Nostoc sp. NIES-2111]